MPNHVYESTEFEFIYDPVSSQQEGRNVTNNHNISHSYIQSILLLGSTAGWTVQATNRKYYNTFVTEAYNVHLNPFEIVTLSGRNVSNLAFSSSWIDITNDPVVQKGASAFYVNTTYRFIRLMSPSYSGAATASPVGFLWTSNSEDGR